MICLALLGERDFDSKLCQVAWSCPESGCGHFGVNVPATMNNFPVRVGAGRSTSSPIWRERLDVAAIHHANLFQHVCLHEFWKRLSAYVDDELLFNGDSAARIAHLRTGHDIHADRL